jgi:Rrf2 family protein
MAGRAGNVVSTKEVAARFEISAALVAKVLQALVHAGLVRSYHGANGGYELARHAAEISIADVIQAVEGNQAAIVDCQHDHDNCDVKQNCTIREPLSILQERISATFASMTVAELANHNFVSVTLT